MEATPRILFLDDNRNRMLLFRQRTSGALIDWAPTAVAAKELLATRDYSEIRLDHDLTEEQTTAFIQGRPARDGAETGMAVVRFIVEHRQRFGGARIIVHSYNATAAPQMVALLRGAGLSATYEPFMVQPEA